MPFANEVSSTTRGIGTNAGAEAATCPTDLESCGGLFSIPPALLPLPLELGGVERGFVERPTSEVFSKGGNSTSRTTTFPAPPAGAGTPYGAPAGGWLLAWGFFLCSGLLVGGFFFSGMAATVEIAVGAAEAAAAGGGLLCVGVCSAGWTAAVEIGAMDFLRNESK